MEYCGDVLVILHREKSSKLSKSFFLLFTHENVSNNSVPEVVKYDRTSKYIYVVVMRLSLTKTCSL